MELRRAATEREKVIWGYGLVSWLVALAFAPPILEVCQRGNEQTQADCHSYHVVVGALFRIVAFVDRHEGFFLVAFTALLWFVTRSLWRATRDMQSISADTLKHLEREFSTTQRPRLVLRRIIERKREDDVMVELANVAGIPVSAANIQAYIWFGVFPTGCPIPSEVLEAFASIPPLAVTITHGGSLAVVVPTRASAPYGRSDVLSGTQTVYCFGYIAYNDATGASIYRLGFVRRFDINLRMWVRADFPDADFEYAD